MPSHEKLLFGLAHRWENYAECRAAPFGALNRNGSMVHIGNPFSDRQSQARAFHLSAGGVGAEEPLEDPLQLLLRYADAAIAHDQVRLRTVRFERQLDTSAGGCVLYGVINQCPQQPPQARPIPAHLRAPSLIHGEPLV